MGGEQDKDRSNESNSKELYYKVKLHKSYESDYEELMWISNGSITEYNEVKKLSMNEYYSLMKYVIDKNRELELRHKEILNKNGR
jgi:hypothetical protein